MLRRVSQAGLLGLVLLVLGASGAQAAQVLAMTERVDFGQAVVGAGVSINRTVTFVNNSSAALEVQAITSTPFLADLEYASSTCPFFPQTTNKLAPGASCAFTITYAPSVLGFESFVLAPDFCVPATNSCASVSSGTVTVTATGVPAETMTLSAPILSFAATPLFGVSPLQTVTLTNGAVPATLGRLLPAGDGGSDFDVVHDGCSQTRLEASATCSFGVRFLPSALGPRTGALALTSTTAGQPPLSLSLSGTGATASSGPAGPQGPAGAKGDPGASGATGKAGRDGQVKLVTCRVVTVKVGKGAKRHTVTKRRCRTKLVTGSASFTVAAHRHGR